jgi:hypothetical protein
MKESLAWEGGQRQGALLDPVLRGGEVTFH